MFYNTIDSEVKFVIEDGHLIIKNYDYNKLAAYAPGVWFKAEAE